MDEEEAENYLVEEEMLVEEAYLQEEENTELERVMTEEEYQDIESYRQAVEENERYQERLNTNVERTQALMLHSTRQKKDTPSRRANIYLIDSHQDLMRSAAEEQFIKISAKFFNINSTRKVANAFKQFEVFSSASFEANEEYKGRDRDPNRPMEENFTEFLLRNSVQRRNMPGHGGRLPDLERMQDLMAMLMQRRRDRDQRLEINDFEVLEMPEFPGQYLHRDRDGDDGRDMLGINPLRDFLFDRQEARERDRERHSGAYRRNEPPREINQQTLESRIRAGIRVVDNTGIADDAAPPNPAGVQPGSLNRFFNMVRSGFSGLQREESRPPRLGEELDNLNELFANAEPEDLFPGRIRSRPSGGSAIGRGRPGQPLNREEPLSPGTVGQNPLPVPVSPQQPQVAQSTSTQQNPENVHSTEVRNDIQTTPVLDNRPQAQQETTVPLENPDSVQNTPNPAQISNYDSGQNPEEGGFTYDDQMEIHHEPSPPNENRAQDDAEPNPEQPRAQAEAQDQIQINFNFRELGLPDNFLEIAGIDREIFASLPYDMQMEIVMQNINMNFEAFSQPRGNQRMPSAGLMMDPVPPVPPQPLNTRINTNSNTAGNTNTNTENNTGNNTENNTGSNTPRQGQPEAAPVNPAQVPPEPQTAQQAPPGDDNRAFLESLPPDMRQEVLMTCPDEFLAGMPPEVVEEARRLRDMSNVHRMRFQPPPDFGAGGIEFVHSSTQQRLAHRGEREAAPRQKKKPQKKVIKVDQTLAVRLFPISQEAAQGFVKLILCPGTMQTFCYTLLAALCTNPDNEGQLFLALHAAIKNEEINQNKTGLLNILTVLERLTTTHRASAVLDYMDMLETVRDMPRHVDMLLRVVCNAVEAAVEEEGKDSQETCRVEIDMPRVKKLCEVLYYRKIDEGTIKILGSLISLLCLNEENLRKFIEELTNTVFSLCRQLNEQLDKDISMLKEYMNNPTEAGLGLIEFSIIKRQNQSNFNETRFLKVFTLILQLYEKSLERAQRQTETQKEGEPQEEPKEGQEKSEKNLKMSPSSKEKRDHKMAEEVKSKVCQEVRAQFSILMSEKSLVHLWLNICESLNSLETIFRDKEKVMIPIISGMKPLIESFFIKYKILCEDEMFDKISLMMTKSKGKDTVKKQMSNLKMEEDNEKGELYLKSSFESLRESNLGINELFVLMCEKNRTAINKMISQSISLLFDSMSVIPKVDHVYKETAQDIGL
jgi:hypothetical protein